MKKIWGVVLSTVLAFVMFVPFHITAAETRQEFDEFGIRQDVPAVKAERLKEEGERKLSAVPEGWTEFPAMDKPVPLNKVFMVNFSGIATKDKIDAIVVERNGQFIPVTISFSNSRQVRVQAKDSLAGNASYQIKVLLANGKKYKMDFKTLNEPRYADIEANDTHIQANDVYLNETVKGEITKGDVDFYRLEVPANGTMNVKLTSLDSTRMSLSLYGSKGSNSNPMALRTNVTQGSVSEGLMPGTYYIRVSANYTGDTSSYELEMDFNESSFEDDNGKTNYISANTIGLNESFTGHVGYYSDSLFGNYDDYFKIEVADYGTLNVDLTGYNAKGMFLALYGEEGNNKNSMKYKTNFTQGGISEGLMPGTYYIRVSTYNDSDYSPYKLDVNFEKSDFVNDNGVSNYLQAQTIGLNESFTGHIGYFKGLRFGNYDDYFKLEVKKKGAITVDLTGYHNKGLSLYLYGNKGNNESSLASKSNFTAGTVTSVLEPGDYYVRVTTYNEDHYSKYKLGVRFVEE